MKRSNYLTFDYDKFDSRGLKKVVAQFEKFGAKVASVSGDNKPKRMQGVQTKKAVLHFNDGQKLTLQVTAQGAIFKVSLNTRVIPVKSLDNLKQAVKEVAEKVLRNSPAFKKALAKKMSKPQKDKKVRAISTLASQIKDLETAKSSLSSEVDDLKSKTEGSKAALSEEARKVSGIEDQIAEQELKKEALEAELKILKES